MRLRTALLPGVLCACVSVTGCATQDIAGPPAPDSPSTTVERPTFPLDDIYGLGRSAQAVARDDTVALYQTWRREVRLRECMQRAGFDWTPEVLLSDDAVRHAAEQIGIPTTDLNSDAATSEANREYVDRLGPERLDDYSTALWGESHEDMLTYGNSGAVPEGHDPDTFASTGCRPVARHGELDVWNLKTTLVDELDAFRADARSTPEFRAALADYTQCLDGFGFPEITDPAGLEAAAVGRETDQAFNECGHLWTDANLLGMQAMAPAFRAEHDGVISKHQQVNAASFEEARHDDTFRAFVSGTS